MKYLYCAILAGLLAGCASFEQVDHIYLCNGHDNYHGERVFVSLYVRAWTVPDAEFLGVKLLEQRGDTNVKISCERIED